jgi:hypothetical protein
MGRGVATENLAGSWIWGYPHLEPRAQSGRKPFEEVFALLHLSTYLSVNPANALELIGRGHSPLRLQTRPEHTSITPNSPSIPGPIQRDVRPLQLQMGNLRMGMVSCY